MQYCLQCCSRGAPLQALRLVAYRYAVWSSIADACDSEAAPRDTHAISRCDMLAAICAATSDMHTLQYTRHAQQFRIQPNSMRNAMGGRGPPRPTCMLHSEREPTCLPACLPASAMSATGGDRRSAPTTGAGDPLPVQCDAARGPARVGRLFQRCGFRTRVVTACVAICVRVPRLRVQRLGDSTNITYYAWRAKMQ